MRRDYWSDSRLADWVRGTTKPVSLTSEEWHRWNNRAKRLYPLRYWIAETLFDRVQDVVNWPNDCIWAIRTYIVNRFVSKTHYLRTRLKPGEWHELEERMLHGLFNELKDFVETETAAFAVGPLSPIELSEPLPWFTKFKKYFRKHHSAADGIAYFRNQMESDWAPQTTLDPTAMTPSQVAREVLELYFWWTNRGMRPDPYEASGWNRYVEWRWPNSKDINFDDDGRTYPHGSPTDLLDALRNIERKYEDEDTEMMIRLVRLRKYLWT